MKYSFVLPSEPFNIKKCDEAFLELFNEFKEEDIKVYLGGYWELEFSEDISL